MNINLPMLCVASKCDDAAVLIRQAERDSHFADPTDNLQEARRTLTAALGLLEWALSPDRDSPCPLKTSEVAESGTKGDPANDF